uniref:CBS domain-containing protein n=1 Tax=Eutreptiella gymnastica TaxID=73025 RepID=A0A7S4C7D1_9EUGL
MDVGLEVLRLVSASPSELEVFKGRPVKDILGSEERRGRHSFRALQASCTINDVMKELVTAQRVIILDELGKVGGVITQSDIARLLYANLPKLGSVVHQTIQALRITAGIARSPIVTCHRGQQLVEVLSQLVNNMIHGMPVVDQFGKFMGSFGINNLKSPEHTPQLSHDVTTRPSMTVDQFLEKVGTRHVVIDDSYELGAVIKLLVESKQHRVYVLDNEHKPVHVISLSDVLVACAPHMHSF